VATAGRSRLESASWTIFLELVSRQPPCFERDHLRPYYSEPGEGMSSNITSTIVKSAPFRTVSRVLSTVTSEQTPSQQEPPAFHAPAASSGNDPHPEQGERMTKSEPQRDEINTLLRHPALYDPVLAPRFPIVLCHGPLFPFLRFGTVLTLGRQACTALM
jgi:hypothetical protein